MSVAWRSGELVSRFDLPVLEIDPGTVAEKTDGSDEAIALLTSDHGPNQPLQWPTEDAHRGSDRIVWLRDHRQSRVDHPMNLPEVVIENRLIRGFENFDDAISAKRFHALRIVAQQKDISGKEWDDGMDPPAVRCPALMVKHRQVVRDALFSQLPSDRLFLSRLRVKTPPSSVRGVIDGYAAPQIVGKQIRFGGQNRHQDGP